MIAETVHPAWRLSRGYKLESRLPRRLFKTRRRSFASSPFGQVAVRSRFGWVRRFAAVRNHRRGVGRYFGSWNMELVSFCRDQQRPEGATDDCLADLR